MMGGPSWEIDNPEPPRRGGSYKTINMKFINYLEKISGVSIYGLSSLVLFTAIFTIMLIWSVKADKKMIDEISRIPLN